MNDNEIVVKRTLSLSSTETSRCNRLFHPPPAVPGDFLVEARRFFKSGKLIPPRFDPN